MSFNKGKNNLISDVEGVTVGHVTLADGDVQTGVTAILPHQGNCFRSKLVANVHVINGFGKSAGLMQLEELGQIETPLVLTNTLSVGTAFDATIKYMLEQNQDIGLETGTINPIILECNDGYLNDIRGQHVKHEHVFDALASTSKKFEQGAVGAGRGMSAYQLKGGIGSASRQVEFDGQTYHVGALVMSNMGRFKDFLYHGSPLSDAQKLKYEALLTQHNEKYDMGHKDQGSIIMVLATDLPLDTRQINRVNKRVTVALALTGSHLGTGSGDVVVGFSTANQQNHDEDGIQSIKHFPENKIDLIFDATIEAFEDAIVSSMLEAETVIGRNNQVRLGLKNII